MGRAQNIVHGMQMQKPRKDYQREDTRIDPGKKIWCRKYGCWKHVKVCLQCSHQVRCVELKEYLIPPLFPLQ